MSPDWRIGAPTSKRGSAVTSGTCLQQQMGAVSRGLAATSRNIERNNLSVEGRVEWGQWAKRARYKIKL